MRSREHRALGEAATAGALVEVGGDCAGDRFLLSYGDLIALSGDFFPSHPLGTFGVDGIQIRPDGRTSEDLFQLAAIPGESGTKLGTQDEVICALRVMAVDGAFADTRFEPGGEFHHFRFTGTAANPAVERRVRDRFLALAAANDDHFVAPGRCDTAHHHRNPSSDRFDSAIVAYHRLHELALDQAQRLGHCRGDQSRAMAREAAAQHYLTDAFAAGHLRTPVTAIRHFWHHRYPRFWQDLQRKVAADTASALRELFSPARILPNRFLDRRVQTAVKTRTSGFPQITLGDLVARVFHDWDNSHGLILQGGGLLFGDGFLEQGVGKALSIAAIRAGIDDVEVAYQLGVSGSPLHGQALYQRIRSATGAPRDAYRAEALIPILSPDNPPQNWQAADAETLWNSPIVGSTGTTVGMAVEETLRLGAEVSRRLDGLGPGIFEMPALMGMPLRRWAARKASKAYYHGFIQGLAQNPKATMLAIVNNSADVNNDTDSCPCATADIEDRGGLTIPAADKQRQNRPHRPHIS